MAGETVGAEGPKSRYSYAVDANGEGPGPPFAPVPPRAVRVKTPCTLLVLNPW